MKLFQGTLRAPNSCQINLKTRRITLNKTSFIIHCGKERKS